MLYGRLRLGFSGIKILTKLRISTLGLKLGKNTSLASAVEGSAACLIWEGSAAADVSSCLS